MDYFKKHSKLLNKYSEEIKSNIDVLKLFPEEKFIDFIECIYASTNIDSQGESLPIEFLKQFIEKTKTRQFYTLENHDNSKAPIGRVLDCKLFYDKEDKQHFVYGITGIYDQQSLRKIRELNIEKGEFVLKFDFTKIRENYNAHLALDQYSLEKEDYHDLINNLPSFLPRRIEDKLYKAAEPGTIITIVTSIFLLLANPFSKKILEIYGERTVQKIDEFYLFLKKHFFVKLLKRNYSRVLAEIESDYNKCQIFLAIDNSQANNLEYAIDTIPEAAASACNFIDKILDYEPTKICFVFKSDQNKWIPEYIITRKKGIIIDTPRLLILEKYKGMSIGGSRGEIEIM